MGDPSLRQHDIQDSRTSACSKVHELKPALTYELGGDEMGKIDEIGDFEIQFPIHRR